MKKYIALLLILLLLVSCTGCEEHTPDYTKIYSSDDYTITEYYTESGQMYRSDVLDEETRITTITFFYWTIINDGTHARVLDRVEVIRINEKGEQVP